MGLLAYCVAGTPQIGARFWVMKGAVYNANNELEDALQALENAIDMDEDCHGAYVQRANTYQRLG